MANVHTILSSSPLLICTISLPCISGIYLLQQQQGIIGFQTVELILKTATNSKIPRVFHGILSLNPQKTHSGAAQVVARTKNWSSTIGAWEVSEQDLKPANFIESFPFIDKAQKANLLRSIED